MRNQDFLDNRRPRRMFGKMFEDAKAFFAVAKHAWMEANRLKKDLSDAAKAQQAKDEAEGVLTVPADDEDFRVESLLTTATFNYFVSLELLLKGFSWVDARFDHMSIKKVKAEVGHDLTEAIKRVSPRYRRKLKNIYQEAGMQEVKVDAAYDPFDPPSGPWIEGELNRLRSTLYKFLHLAERRGFARARYSFELTGGAEWRIKLCGCSRLVTFHRRVEELLLDCAKENGCMPRLDFELTVCADDGSAPLRILAGDPEEEFKFDQMVSGKQPPETRR